MDISPSEQSHFNAQHISAKSTALHPTMYQQKPLMMGFMDENRKHKQIFKVTCFN